MEPASDGVKRNNCRSSCPLQPAHMRLTRLREYRLRYIFGDMSDTLQRKAIDRFLRQLRASGRSNMYGAVPYVMKVFSVDRHAAFAMICEWLDGQLDSTSPEESRTRSKTRTH